MRQSFFDLDIDRKLKILIASRLVLVIAMLGGAILSAFLKINFYYLIGSVCLISIFYIFALKNRTTHLVQAYSQIILDVVFISGLIHWTGGIDSPFIFLYILPIISAAVIISSRASIIIAMASSVFYTIFVKLESYEIIRPFNPASYSDQDVVTYLVFLHVSMMIIISLLGGYLSESLRRKGTELRELKSFTDEILNNIPNGVIAFDSSDRITYANNFARGFLKIPDRRNPDIEDCFVTEIWPPGSVPDPESAAKGKGGEISFYQLRRHQLIEGERELADEAGKKMSIRFAATRLFNEKGKIKGGVVIFYDLFKERLSAMGEMAAELAHEIKNPLAAISGSLEVLKEEYNSEGNDGLIELMLKETQCLNNIVNDFLNFSRPRKLTPVSYPIKKVIEEALALLKNHPNFSDLIEIDISSSIDPKLMIDPDEMRQAFLNLSLNAMDAMPLGGKLSIKIERGRADAIKVYFSDEGPGIKHKDREHLFEPFYTTKERGVGLGLAISSRIVRDHGGDISIVDNSGPGAAFVITLPRG